MMNKLNNTIEFILNCTLFLIIALSPVGIMNIIVELNNDIFSNIFGFKPDVVMRIIYITLPFIALNIIWWVLSFKIVTLIKQNKHKKFNALWFCYSEDILDVFLIYRDSSVWSLLKLIKKFKYERYDLKTGELIHRGFTTLKEKIFNFEEKESDNSVSVMIPVCNHDIPTEKMFVEISLHLDDKEFDYATVYNIKNNKKYKRIKIKKYIKSDDLLKLIRKKDKFDNKYNEIIKEFLNKENDKNTEKQIMSNIDINQKTINKDDGLIVETKKEES